MEDIINQVKQFAGAADETTRKKLMTSLRDISYSFERPDDTVHRIGYLHLQTAAARVGIDLKLFELLVESKSSLSVAYCAQATGAHPLFLGRLLRYLSSVGMIKELGQETYAANNITEALAVQGNQAGICHIFDTCGPQYQEMPKYLKKVSYQNITDHHHTVFQDAWKTDLGAFEWFVDQPQALDHFNQYMAARREATDTWLSVYPVEEETKMWNPEAPVYVNMGGSIGHQCAEFRVKYPHVPGRVILQDLPHSIERALPTPGVENMVHDFFQPQPVKAAKFYFLRGVLHNHPDDKVQFILQNIISAMGKDSVLLIDEMVLPDTDVDWQATSIDLTMMCACGSRERTEQQWQALLDSVGLTILKILTYRPSVYESVMAAVPNKLSY